jgi:AraC family transcriptional activator of mtrCDE
MDALSRLLTLYPLQTALDVRCQFGAPWLLDHPGTAAGTAPYHLIVSGSAVFDAGRLKGNALRSGDIVVFPHGAPHRLYLGDPSHPAPSHVLPGEHLLQQVRNEGAGPGTNVLCGEFHFEDQRSAALLAALPEVMIVHTEGHADAASLGQLMSLLQTETEASRPGAGAIVGQLASALFALLIRAWMEQSDTLPGLFAVLAERRLQPALQAMLAAPEKPWSLEDLAAACHMSRATFARLFKQAANATPADVLAQLRMAQAARLLDQGRQSVGSIAEAVGYQSEAAFNRAFKRQYGVGPGAFRSNRKRQGSMS